MHPCTGREHTEPRGETQVVIRAVEERDRVQTGKASGSKSIGLRRHLAQRPNTKKVSDPQHKSVQHLQHKARVGARTSAPHTRSSFPLFGLRFYDRDVVKSMIEGYGPLCIGRGHDHFFPASAEFIRTEGRCPKWGRLEPSLWWTLEQKLETVAKHPTVMSCI